MEDYYTDLDTAVMDRIDYWRNCGYSIKVSEDKKHIEFANNIEKLPCFIDIAHGKTICSGDYGNFIFSKEYDLENPYTIYYFSSKYEGGESTGEFNYDLLQKQLKSELEEIKKEYDVSKLFCKEFIKAFDEYNGFPGDLDRATDKLIQAIRDDEFDEESKVQFDVDYEAASMVDCYDWKESWYDNLGSAYNPRFIAQLAILQFACEYVSENMKNAELENEAMERSKQ